MTIVNREIARGERDRAEKGRKLAAVLPRTALVILMMVALAYWTWYGTTQRSLTGDEVISLMAAQGIAEHGYPLMPSGYVYHRGYITNYLTAGSILALGLNEFAIMLPSLLMALGGMLLVYLLARDVLGRPLVGVVAAALLMALQVQTFYATGPRMYMGLQFFTLLASYSAWQGYVRGDTRFQWITALAIFGALFENHQGGVLLVAIPAAVLLARWLKRRSAPKASYALALSHLALLCGVFLYLQWYGLPGGLHHTASGGAGVAQEGLRPKLDPGLWFSHMRVLEYTVPFGLMLVPLIAVHSLHAFQERGREGSQGFLYVLLIFAICALATMAIVNVPRNRLWMFVLPAYTLLLSYSVAATMGWLGRGRQWRWHGLDARVVVAISLAAGVIPLVLVASAVRGPAAYVDLLASAYGFPCTASSCSRSGGEAYSALRSAVERDDVIITSNPFRTYHYLGRVDGWLREKPEESGSFTSFDSATDEYFGIPLIDSIDKLLALRDSQLRVWVITTGKVETHSSQTTLDTLENEFAIYQADVHLRVYTNFSKLSGDLPSPEAAVSYIENYSTEGEIWR